MKALGYQGYPGYRLGRIHDAVLPSLMRRLPPRIRPDFEEYKEQFRIPKTLNVSDVELLALTEAKLPSDGFSVVDPLNVEAQANDLLLEVAGFRYYANVAQPLMVSQSAELIPEPENQYDTNAIKICVSGLKIGYINRLQAPTIGVWLRSRNVRVILERLNGKGNKPRAFVFIRVRPSCSHALPPPAPLF